MSSQPISVTFNLRDQNLQAKWTIKNFLTIADTIESPLFSHKLSEVKWCLTLDRSFEIDGLKYVKVKICTRSPVKVSVLFDINFETAFGDAVIQKKHLPELIGPQGCFIPGRLVKVADIGEYIKLDGTLVVVVWMDYSTLTCDRDWINTRLAMSDGLKQILDGKYSDITFKIDRMTIKAHKVIVSRCKYFETMFDGSNLESNTGVIEITDFKFAIVRGLLEYIYSGWVDLKSVHFAIDLRLAADKYDLPGLLTRTEIYVSRNVRPWDVAKAILSTTVLESLMIKEACAKLIRSNPEDIVDCGDIFDNKELRVYLLQRD